MKRMFVASIAVGSMLTMAMMTSGCDSNNEKNGENSEIISQQVADSLSMAMGAFTGANLNWIAGQEIPADQKAQVESDLNEFIEGFQLVMGNKFSANKLDGIYAALSVINEIDGAEQTTGAKINRSLYLQQFRKYIQDANLTPEELTQLYLRQQAIRSNIESILEKINTADVENDTTFVAGDEDIQLNIEYQNDSIVVYNANIANDEENVDFVS